MKKTLLFCVCLFSAMMAADLHAMERSHRPQRLKWPATLQNQQGPAIPETMKGKDQLYAPDELLVRVNDGFQSVLRKQGRGKRSDLLTALFRRSLQTAVRIKSISRFFLKGIHFLHFTG